MMRSLFSGVSGLNNHQTRMDVIGNNISNVNTHGFKKDRVGFQDLIYQSISGASKPSDSSGGINPKQVGLGMAIAAVSTIHTQGALESTGNIADLAILGEGFFVLKEGENSFYTRMGAFSLDANGTLVNPATGAKVQGWTAQEINGESLINSSSDPSDLTIRLYGKEPPRATTRVELASNLDKNLGVVLPDSPPEVVQRNTWVIDKTIFDSFGNTHTLRLSLVRAVDGAGNPLPNTWSGTAVVDPTGDSNTVVSIPPADTAVGGANTFTVQFDNRGGLQQATDNAGNNIAGAADAQGNPVPGTSLQLQLAFNVADSNPDGGGNLLRQNLTLDLGQVGDFSDSLTQDAAAPTSKAVRQDGYGLGYMTAYEIDETGTVVGVYDNGVRKELARLAMATFVNSDGLEKAGEVNFTASSNSGDARISPAKIAGAGSIRSGSLEMSNVDLATEFVDMITTQRGFQANSRTIQTSDQMLQELLSLKR